MALCIFRICRLGVAMLGKLDMLRIASRGASFLWLPSEVVVRVGKQFAFAIAEQQSQALGDEIAMGVDARHVVDGAAAFATTAAARAHAWQADEIGNRLFAPAAKVIAGFA